MQIAWFLLVAVLAAMLGWSAVMYLTASPLVMTAYAVLSVSLSIVLLVMVLTRFAGWRKLGAAGLLLAAFAGGWLVTNALFLAQEEHRVLPELNPPPQTARDHVAVVYLTHGEPPGYSPMPWVETMKEMDADKAPFIPVPFRPFFFNAFRGEYLKVGGSPHNYIHETMLNSVEKIFRQAGDTNTRFYIAFLDSNPRPDEAVLRAINNGASRVVLANVFLTISSHTQAGQEMVEDLNLDAVGVPVCYSEPLWDSDALKQMFINRANANLNGSDKANVGVLLVGHGQPREWDAIYPTQTEQELAFREDLVERFVADGYTRENVRLAWMEFKEPNTPDVAAELGARGLEKIFVFSASISASSLHSLYDTPEAVRGAGIPAGTQVINLGAWNDDPLVIQAIREKIDRCMQTALN